MFIHSLVRLPLYVYVCIMCVNLFYCQQNSLFKNNEPERFKNRVSRSALDVKIEQQQLQIIMEIIALSNIFTLYSNQGQAWSRSSKVVRKAISCTSLLQGQFGYNYEKVGLNKISYLVELFVVKVYVNDEKMDEYLIHLNQLTLYIVENFQSTRNRHASFIKFHFKSFELAHRVARSFITLVMSATRITS